MRRRLAFTFFLSSLWTLNLLAQTVPPPGILWQKSFGGVASEQCFVIRQAADGGYLVVGASQSGASGNKQSTNYGGMDGWVLRLDRQGNRIWEQNIGGTGHDEFRDARQTSDGGWILLGSSSSAPSGNKTSPLWGADDFWAVRLDLNGTVLWDKSYGGTGVERGAAVQLTANGFLIGGSSSSGSNGNKAVSIVLDEYGDSYGPDIWLLSIDTAGEILWQRGYGGYRDEVLVSIEPRIGGGFLCIGGSSSPPSGNKQSPNYSTYNDYWLFCIDDSGEILWEQSYGGIGDDLAIRACQTDDGGWVIVGNSESGISGNKTTPLEGASWDIWVLRVNSQGEKIWEQTFGGPGNDGPADVFRTPDGGFIIGGSRGIPIFDPYAALIRLDASGNRLWEKTYSDLPISVYGFLVAPDGGLLMAGTTAYPGDFMVVKLAPDLLTTPRLRIISTEVRLQLNGIPGKTYVTEATSDFLDWTRVATNTLISTQTEIIDSTSAPRQFYRAWMLP